MLIKQRETHVLRLTDQRWTPSPRSTSFTIARRRVSTAGRLYPKGWLDGVIVNVDAALDRFHSYFVKPWPIRIDEERDLQRAERVYMKVD